MIRTRIKILIGRHPALAVSVLSAVGVLPWAVAEVLRHCFGEESLFEYLNALEDKVKLLVSALLIAIGTAVVGLMLGRSLGTSRNLWRALAWGPVAAVAAFVGIVVVFFLEYAFNCLYAAIKPGYWFLPSFWDFVGHMRFYASYWVCFAASAILIGQIAGWAIAATITRWKKARGSWQPPWKIQPAGEAARDWIVVHPVRSELLAVLACTVGINVLWMAANFLDIIGERVPMVLGTITAIAAFQPVALAAATGLVWEVITRAGGRPWKTLVVLPAAVPLSILHLIYALRPDSPNYAGILQGARLSYGLSLAACLAGGGVIGWLMAGGWRRRKPNRSEEASRP